jgi:hypothetical protein
MDRTFLRSARAVSFFDADALFLRLFSVGVKEFKDAGVLHASVQFGERDGLVNLDPGQIAGSSAQA